jgi:RHS repeat-associated protein
VTDASGSKAYEYDLLGRVTKVTETRGAPSFVTEYGYDLAGNITDITLPSGREISYTLNANGQVSAVAADVAGSPVTLASSITYLPFGPLNGLTYGNALTFSAGFDQDYNPTSRAVSSIFSDTYDTDQVGNITQRGSVTFDYDAAGNITDDGTRVYVWDDAGRLKEVEISSTTVGAYTYNASNQRAIKVASSVTTHYIYGASGLLYGEYDSAGDMIREYIYLNGEPLTQINDGSPETPTYLHTDNLGTPRYGTSAAGSQVWAWDSDAFGNGTPSGSVTVNLRMAGQYHDAETDLLYNWNRYYNPEIGRYVSSDPIGLEGGINTFNYVQQNPLLYTDPTGEAIPLVIAACLSNPACTTLSALTAGVVINTGVNAAQKTYDFIQQNRTYSEDFGNDQPKICKNEAGDDPAANSVERCKQKCDAALEDGDKLCTMLSSPRNQALCYQENFAIYSKCLKECR